MDEVVGQASEPDGKSASNSSIGRLGGLPHYWHTLIEADNYYALQLLAYLYPGKVDCIYIDPPYNTGARDWKYNNDYVDSSDQYRHSKWLSMMKRRLLLAKELLNPKDSVLIVTIDEKEYLHLGCLLEELFPEARMQMVTSVISAKGVVRAGQFSRVEEYIFIIELGQSKLTPFEYNMLDSDIKKESNRSIEWLGFRRRAPQAVRESRPNQFYPIFVDKKTGNIHSIGEVLPQGIDRNTVIIPDNCIALWPLSKEGDERLWSLQQKQAVINWGKGYLKVNWNEQKEIGTVYYLPEGTIEDIENGSATTLGYNNDGSIKAKYCETGTTPPKRVWNMQSHNAETYGTTILSSMIGKRFNFPKSLYAVHDTIRFFVANKPNALIVDFFAGSGTTLHAVNLLNAEDGGNRRCIMVTNNEVSEQEAKTLTKRGFKPGDEEWERWGIARYVNWPRTVCSIEGHDVNGEPLKGEYLVGDASKRRNNEDEEAGEKGIAGNADDARRRRPLSEGFAANCAFFKLNFLDKTQVALGRQFRELLPLLWMKAGAEGRCPRLESDQVPPMLVLSENRFAVLTDEKYFGEFLAEVEAQDAVRTVYLVVDSDTMYREMSRCFPRRQTCQLYRDYLDNFRINTPRQ
ncbi:MAG: site-specific DNA-methyltransferase [Bacteroidales bacterium]|nr:site-specific DNA-methyltransferase [Bacteroidales bacterium]